MKWYKYNIKDLDDNEFYKWYSLMDKNKQQRVDKFRFEKDKKRTVVGEMLARQAIAKYCNVSEESIFFDKTVYGKPFVKKLNIEFNISHSGNMVVCAIADKPIGIDVEQIRRIDLNIAKRVCTEKELRYVFGLVPNVNDYNQLCNIEVLMRFFEVWTYKEAYGKCIGLGMVENIFTISKTVNVVKNWVFDDYCMTICIEN